MKEKKIFMGIIITAMLVVGAIVYRSSRQPEPQEVTFVNGEQALQQIATSVQQNSTATPIITVPAKVVPVTPTQAPINENKPGQVTVRYTGAGFSPSALTVKMGTTVVFLNAGSVDMWVASAPHPAHTEYLGFDALRPIKPGQSYAFTFARLGTWRYHNHLNASQYGSVTVTQ